MEPGSVRQTLRSFTKTKKSTNQGGTLKSQQQKESSKRQKCNKQIHHTVKFREQKDIHFHVHLLRKLSDKIWVAWFLELPHQALLRDPRLITHGLCSSSLYVQPCSTPGTLNHSCFPPTEARKVFDKSSWLKTHELMIKTLLFKTKQKPSLPVTRTKTGNAGTWQAYFHSEHISK